MRKMVYLFFSILAFLLAGTYQLEALLFVSVAAIFLFFAMLLVSQYCIRNVTVEIKLERSQVQKHQVIRGWLQVENRGGLPISVFLIYLRCLNSRIKEENMDVIQGYVPRKDQVCVDFQLSSEYCGIISLQIDEILTYDYLSLFYGSKVGDHMAEVMIFPSGKSLSFDAKLSGDFVSFSEREVAFFSGSQPPDIFQIQQYQQGDSMKDIHWKLSARNDQLLSKQYCKEEAGKYVILSLDLKSAKEVNIQQIDAFLELTSAISLGLLQAELPHQLRWYDLAHDHVVERIIFDESDYTNMVEELILTVGSSNPLALEGESRSSIDAYFPKWSSYSTEGGITLHLNLGLELFANGEFIYQFSRDNYMQDIESGCIII